MRFFGILSCISCLVLVAACGGSEPQAATPSSAADGDNGASTAPSASTAPEPAPSPASTAEAPKANDAESPPPSSKPDVPTPPFKENGSVRDAINAVPQGTPRLNIEQEALGRPLNNPELYEPCNPGNAHFKAKVAIWDGKAVGLDLSTTPKNAKFAECIAGRIRSITWPDKVKSLNVVEYTF